MKKDEILKLVPHNETGNEFYFFSKNRSIRLTYYDNAQADKNFFQKEVKKKETITCYISWPVKFSEDATNSFQGYKN